MKPLKKVLKDRFIIMQELGQGGYGSVYKALDNETKD